jgi:hypothetical protein
MADAIRRLADVVEALPVDDAAGTIAWVMEQLGRVRRAAGRA